MSRDRVESAIGFEVPRRKRARAYARRAYHTLWTMRQYGAEGRGDGVANGVRALGALFSELTSTRATCRCPICGWSGPRFAPDYFYDSFQPGARCYACGSAARCRLFKLFIRQHLADFFAAARRRVLDIGPEPYSRSFFPRDVHYVSFDLYNPLAAIRGDLSRAPFADGGCDFWICSHVLDVIPDDTAAMRELLRVLAPHGIGLLDNAMCWDGPTQEYGAPRRGDSGRLRRYGTDLVDRLRSVGFEVEIVDPSELFDADARARGGLWSLPIVLCRHPGSKREDSASR
jgi:SAM-dependent methyltransferase